MEPKSLDVRKHMFNLIIFPFKIYISWYQYQYIYIYIIYIIYTLYIYYIYIYIIYIIYISIYQYISCPWWPMEKQNSRNCRMLGEHPPGFRTSCKMIRAMAGSAAAASACACQLGAIKMLTSGMVYHEVYHIKNIGVNKLLHGIICYYVILSNLRLTLRIDTPPLDFQGAYHFFCKQFIIALGVTTQLIVRIDSWILESWKNDDFHY